jgi:tetratricopeptide (TPR) repeat protein
VRRSTRHQLKQDQFTAAAQETVSWAVEHRNKLMYGGGALAVVLAIVIGGWAYYQHQNEAAGVALGHALQVYQAPVTGAEQSPTPSTTAFGSVEQRAKAAHAEFAKVVQEYPHTRSAEIARYFLGLTHAQAGESTEAEAELKQAAGSGPADVAALAKYALAAQYRKQGKDAEAVKLYRDLIDHPSDTVPKAEAQLALAEVYEAKQPQDARNLYQQVQREDPQGPAAQIAANRLSGLK